MAKLQARVLARILTLAERLDYAQKGLADHLRVSQGTMSKILSGKQDLTLAYIEDFCFVFQVTPEELVAEPGSQMVVLRPMEPDLLARFREMEEKDQKSLIDVLDWRLKKPQLLKGKRSKFGKAEPALVLTAAAIEVAKRFQAAPADARQLVTDALSLDARHRMLGTTEQTTDLPHRATGSHGRDRKPQQ